MCRFLETYPTYFFNLLSSFNDEEGAKATKYEILFVIVIMFNL